MNGAVGSSAALWEQYRCANVYYFNFLRPALRQRTVRRLASWKASRRRISGSGQRGRWNDYSLLSLSPNLSRRLFGAEFRCGEIRNGRSLHRGDRGRPTAMLLQPAHAQGQRPTPKKRLGWTLTHHVTGAPRRSQNAWVQAGAGKARDSQDAGGRKPGIASVGAGRKPPWCAGQPRTLNAVIGLKGARPARPHRWAVQAVQANWLRPLRTRPPALGIPSRSPASAVGPEASLAWAT